jgi:leader peptidase (prepilin peptidase)/N-methyltransferase
MIEIIFSLILGFFIGSFLNCTVLRVYNEESFVKGNSKCPHCKHKLGVKDLIPIFSYASLKGKCRYCREKISSQYFWSEVATGLLFALVAFLTNASFFTMGIFNIEFLEYLFYLVVASYFVMIFLFDARWFIIPDGLTFSAIIITILWLLSGTFIFGIYTEQDLLFRFLSAFGVFLFFFALHFFSHGKAMGFGDVKLVVFLGLLLGWPNILIGMFLGFFLGAVIGLVIMMLQKKGIKTEIPFGPFLVVGTFIAMFWGNDLIDYYLNLM